jgi:hypothetical protein
MEWKNYANKSYDGNNPGLAGYSLQKLGNKLHNDKDVT